MNEEPAPIMRCRCGKTGAECLTTITTCAFFNAGRQARLKRGSLNMPKTAGGKKWPKSAA